MLCFRCGSYNSDDVQKCTVCGQELIDRGGKAIGPMKKPTTASQQALIFAPGEVVAGRYKIVDLIGQGGVGAVYRARDNEVDVDVALKGVSPNLLQTEDEQKQFSKAIKAARKLQHPNIVRLYDEGQHLQPTRRFFTMKLLEGLTLRKIIRLRHDKQQAFSPEEIGPIFQQLASALDYAHKQTWHGDLKPENVVVLPDLLKITDFALMKALPLKPFLGIAKSRSKGFPYIAPELRVESQSIDGRCDVYSLGVILAEMLTGLVYEGHFSRTFTAALEQLPTRLDGLVRRALADHPDGRFAKAGELAKELDLALNALGGQPLPPPVPAKDATSTGLPRTEQRGEAKADQKAPARPELRGGGSAPPEKARPSIAPPPPPLETNPSQRIPPPPPARSDEDVSLLEIGQSQVLLLENSSVGSEARVIRDELSARAGSDGGAAAAQNRRLAGIDAENADDTVDEPTLQGQQADDIDTNPGGRPASRKFKAPAGERPPLAENLIESIYADEGSDSLVPPPLPSDSNLDQSSLDDSVDGIGSLRSTSERSTQEGRLVAPARAPAAQPSEPSQPAQPAIGGGDGDEDVATSATQPLRSLASDEQTGERRASAAEALGLSSDEGNDVTQGMRAPARSEAGEAIHDALTALKRHPRPELIEDPDLRDALTRTAGTAIDRDRPPPLPPAIEAGDEGADAGTRTVPLGSPAAPALVGAGVLGDHDLQPPPVVAPPLRPVAPPRAIPRQGPNPVLIAAGVAAVALVIFFGGKHLLQRDSVQREDGALVTIHQPAAHPPATVVDAGVDEAASTPPTEAPTSAGATTSLPTVEPAATLDPSSTAPSPTASSPTASSPTAPPPGSLAATAPAATGAATTGVDASAGAGEDAAERQRRERAEAEARAMAEMQRREAAAATTTTPEPKPEPSTPEPAARPDAVVALASGACPAGMARIDAGSFTFGSSGSDPMRNFGEIDAASVEARAFCIDYYEAPNGKDKLPTTGVSWQTAKSACDRAGKRLCTEVEWERACKGPSSLRFPYGNTYDPDTCNTEDGDGRARSMARPVDFKKCRSGFKVFMLSGNAEEWVQDAAGGQRILKGGAADRPDFASRCSARRAVSARTSTPTTGFRCCADPR
jgi:serine/threonine protein kinase/formylglycine-generating enzyme required for sulfatase activity